MQLKQSIQEYITSVLKDMGLEISEVELTHPPQLSMGDYTTNIALVAAKKAGRDPRALARLIGEKLSADISGIREIDRVEIAGPGFINIFLKQEYFLGALKEILSDSINKPLTTSITGKKIMVEYAHPNTHKEMHIGHMRTLITGEAVARLLEAGGAEVFRANYQGDIGPHVAKAIYGIKVLLERDGETLDEVKGWDNIKKARFLGRAYALGNSEYDEHKEEIDRINNDLYQGGGPEWELYQESRKWSLDYYEDFYKRFSTRFDRLFFESEMARPGKELVQKHVGTVFTEENGAIIFKGEEYGLHTRVFVTQAGHPTYEAKDIANAYKQFEVFPFDRNIHVVANEQAGYFQVVIKALELIDPEKFKGREYHLSMGMVQLSDRKMSSRTGDVLTVDWLLDEVKQAVNELMSDGRIEADERDAVVEQITVGAVKHSVLKVGTAQNVAFDIKTSVSLEGNSGPYLQYTYARTNSVLEKSGSDRKFDIGNLTLESEEVTLLKLLVQYQEVVVDAAENMSPSTVTNYLFDLAQTFNLFYQKQRILQAEGEQRELRLALTQATGTVLKHGLHLLGIQTPEKM